jgi:hypothetical protein
LDEEPDIKQFISTYKCTKKYPFAKVTWDDYYLIKFTGEPNGKPSMLFGFLPMESSNYEVYFFASSWDEREQSFRKLDGVDKLVDFGIYSIYRFAQELMRRKPDWFIGKSLSDMQCGEDEWGEPDEDNVHFILTDLVNKCAYKVYSNYDVEYYAV